MLLFVSGAPLSTICETPTNLSRIYQGLPIKANRNSFLVPNEYISPLFKQNVHLKDITCPKTLPTNGGIKDLSVCPWSTKIITDSTLFPPVRSEAVCRCQDCIGADGMHNCEMVFIEMTFLQRTSVCVDGSFVYEPITKRIPTGCVCAHKRIIMNPLDN